MENPRASMKGNVPSSATITAVEQISVARKF